MITAHDFPSAHVADHAGMDMILVGDSLAMVALGMEDTSEVLMEEMLLHVRCTRDQGCVYSKSTTSIPTRTWLANMNTRSATSPWAPTRSPPSKPSPPPSA
jgi:hypothetical protein